MSVVDRLRRFAAGDPVPDAPAVPKPGDGVPELLVELRRETSGPRAITDPFLVAMPDAAPDAGTDDAPPPEGAPANRGQGRASPPPRDRAPPRTEIREERPPQGARFGPAREVSADQRPASAVGGHDVARTDATQHARAPEPRRVPPAVTTREPMPVKGPNENVPHPVFGSPPGRFRSAPEPRDAARVTEARVLREMERFAAPQEPRGRHEAGPPERRAPEAVQAREVDRPAVSIGRIDIHATAPAPVPRSQAAARPPDVRAALRRAGLQRL